MKGPSHGETINNYLRIKQTSSNLCTKMILSRFPQNFGAGIEIFPSDSNLVHFKYNQTASLIRFHSMRFWIITAEFSNALFGLIKFVCVLFPYISTFEHPIKVKIAAHFSQKVDSLIFVLIVASFLMPSSIQHNWYRWEREELPFTNSNSWNRKIDLQLQWMWSRRKPNFHGKMDCAHSNNAWNWAMMCLCLIPNISIWMSMNLIHVSFMIQLNRTMWGKWLCGLNSQRFNNPPQTNTICKMVLPSFYAENSLRWKRFWRIKSSNERKQRRKVQSKL